MNALTVCMLTAGKGSRMGGIGRTLNKALLPINGKATISHIINKFPPHTEFVIGLSDKTMVTDPAYQAFVGLCHIQDYLIFWRALESTTVVAGEHQISNGIQALIQQTNVVPQAIAWSDVGDAEKYKEMVSRYENFDFSKSNEALYIINGKVIKFFVDAKVTERRVCL